MKQKSHEEIVNEEFEKAEKDAELAWQYAESELQEPEVLLNYLGKPVCFKNNIVLIQGKTGCHKSRLATALVSLLVSNNPQLNLLGFTQAIEESPVVLYMDTERNINYQLPVVIRQLLSDSGLDKNSLKSRFKLLPLANVQRNFRTRVMGKQFSVLNKSTKQHYVIVLDIVSDFISNFNDIIASMDFIDMINTASNMFDLTFMVILHENPGAEKARGHLGTELSNKASTIFQISQTESKDIFQLKILKSRSTEKYEKVLLKFDPSINNLKVVDDEKMILEVSDPEMTKLCKVLSDKFFDSIEKQDLFSLLADSLKWSERKIHDQLKKLMERGIQFDTIMGKTILTKKRGKTAEFEMIPLESSE